MEVFLALIPILAISDSSGSGTKVKVDAINSLVSEGWPCSVNPGKLPYELVSPLVGITRALPHAGVPFAGPGLRMVRDNFKRRSHLGLCMLDIPYFMWPWREKRKLADPSTAWLSLHARMNGRIKIYFVPCCKETANRIELSSGTRVADMRETADLIHGAAYEEGARLPREPWRRPTAEEARSLIVAEVPSNMATSVAIVQLPGEFSGLQEAIRSGDNELLEVNLLQPLRTICELGETLHCIGPSKNPANLKTVTVNHDIGRYNGLHVDNWDQLHLDSRHLATNRLCINIGQQDRYFLFLPLSLMDIAIALSEEMGPQWEAPGRYTLIGRQFMERFPDVPVVRCRLGPGEAYIAPTENLVHDGSSVGQGAMDEQFTIRGHIRLL